MKFAILDDSSSDRNALKSYLFKYMEKHHISAQISEFSSAEQFLEISSDEKFTVIFLDIYMKNKTGMDVAKELFSSGNNAKLIFLSNSTDYLRQSYSVRAVYYLVKPIVAEEFELAMRFLELKPEYDVPYLEIVHDGVKRKIPTEKIFYIDVYCHTTEIHTENNTISVSASFHQIVQPLEKDERFLKCIRGVIVNMQHIQDFNGNSFILSNGKTVPVSIRCKKKISETWRMFLYNHMEG